jgi:hypothetical protein
VQEGRNLQLLAPVSATESSARERGREGLIARPRYHFSPVTAVFFLSTFDLRSAVYWETRSVVCYETFA